MGKYNIRIDTEKCTGCLRCRLACSLLFTQKFKPSEARIQIIPSDTKWTIVFTDDCTMCGICSDNCFFDALVKAEKETAT